MGSGRVCRQQITPLSTRPTDSQGRIFMVFLPLHLLLRSSFSPKFPKHVPFAVAQPSMIFFLLFAFLLMPSCQHISSLTAVPSSLESEWCEFNVMISCRGNISGKEKRNYISLLHTTFHQILTNSLWCWYYIYLPDEETEAQGHTIKSKKLVRSWQDLNQYPVDGKDRSHFAVSHQPP